MAIEASACSGDRMTHFFQETIKAVTEAQGGAGMVYVTDPGAPIKSIQDVTDPSDLIKTHQHPIPQKELGDVKPLMTTSSIPR